MNDMISRKAAIDTLETVGYDFSNSELSETELAEVCEAVGDIRQDMINRISRMPSVQPEPLTDKEQRIFLAAMRREEKVCEEVDRNYVRESYEDSLMRVCKEIRRKVKGALWT